MRARQRIDNKKTALLLREALRKRGVKQTAMAGEIGLNQSQISRLVNGDFQRYSKGLYALCGNLKVNPVVRDRKADLTRYPELASFLVEVLDGSRKREKAIIRLLKSAQVLA